MRYSRIGGHYYGEDQVRQAAREIVPGMLAGVAGCHRLPPPGAPSITARV
jgi:hypothetical protein